MLLSMHHLYESYTRLKNLQLKLEKELDILKRREEKESEGKKVKERNDLEVDAVRSSFNNAFLDLVMVVEESRKMAEGDRSALMALQVIMPIIRQRIDQAQTVEDMFNVLKMITEPLDQWIYMKKYERLSYYDYAYYFRDKWITNYSTNSTFDIQAMDNIFKAVQWRYDKVNIFEMLCRNDHIPVMLSNSNRKVDVYGFDMNKCLNSGNRGSFKRVIYGTLKGCVISNACFDIAICAPSITVNREMKGGAYVKKERELMFKAVDYLRPEGWLIFVIPYFRLYSEICNHLVKHYHHFQLFTDKENSGTLYIICQKRTVPATPETIDVKMYGKLRNMPLNYNDLPQLPNLEDIKLPDKTIEIKRFRGSELNEAELVDMHNISKCTVEFWKDQQVEKLGNSQARPLLPFNIGQLGLILTSGCLDGIVEEGNGYCHVVKGRVVKKTDTIENIDSRTHQVQIVNTTSNRVEISAFLPDGTYKCLA